MSDWKNSPRESGYYPPGAEHDPRAPWNQIEDPYIECPVCNGSGIMDGEDCPICDGDGCI